MGSPRNIKMLLVWAVSSGNRSRIGEGMERNVGFGVRVVKEKLQLFLRREKAIS